MNKRILKKQLKKKIERLENENRMMKKIIDAEPQMSALYDRMTKPVSNTYTNVQIDKLAVRQTITSADEFYWCHTMPEEYRDICIERYKDLLERQIGDAVKGYINYDVVFDGFFPFVQATIYVGKADT